jgi:hypothetical protein
MTFRYIADQSWMRYGSSLWFFVELYSLRFFYSVWNSVYKKHTEHIDYSVYSSSHADSV